MPPPKSYGRVHTYHLISQRFLPSPVLLFPCIPTTTCTHMYPPTVPRISSPNVLYLRNQLTMHPPSHQLSTDHRTAQHSSSLAPRAERAPIPRDGPSIRSEEMRLHRRHFFFHSCYLFFYPRQIAQPTRPTRTGLNHCVGTGWNVG
jgi:hypothetical protein